MSTSDVACKPTTNYTIPCSAQSMSGANIKKYSKIRFDKDENSKALDVSHSYYH